MNTIQVKICGMTSEDAVLEAVQQKAAFLGFIFHPASPRYITPERAAELASLVPATIRKVAVVVDLENKQINEIMKIFRPDMLQLHGKESALQISNVRERFGLPVIKAVKVASAKNFQALDLYKNRADMLLFDTQSKTKDVHGGTGQPFDWSFMKGQRIPMPWFLSGGLKLENVEEAVRTTGARFLDISSGVERAPGVKDPGKIAEFMEKIRNL